MLRKMLVAAAAVMGLAVSSQAGVIITSSGSPTVGLAGYTTYTLTAQSDNGAQVVGFDFASQPSFGFFGPMNQVNPFGQPTVFADNNAIIAGIGGQVSQDSQFKFLSTTMTVPAGFASESSNSLRALFASAVGLGTSVPFAQIAVKGSATINFAGQIYTQLGSANPVENNVAGWVFGSCPACGPFAGDELIDNVDASNPGVVQHTMQVNSGLATTTLAQFVFQSFVPPPGGTGTGPAIPATLNGSTFQFNWNTIGSPLGTYKWTYFATNTFGVDSGSLTVRITVPEPATVTLLGLTVVGCSFVRRECVVA